MPLVAVAGAGSRLYQSPSGGGSTALFTDAFSTGDLSHSENGISWGAANVGAGDGSVSVVAGAGFGGANALRFRFASGAQDRWVEQRLAFSPGFNDQFWMRYYFWVPSNYNHEGPADTFNDKFWLALWGGSYGTPFPSTPGIDFNLWGNGDGSSSATVFFFNQAWGTGYHAWGATNDAITLADRGQWMRLVFNRTLPSGPGDYGRVRVWKDAGATGSYTKIIDVTSNSATDDDIPQGSDYVTGQSYLDQAYLMGWKNSMNTNQQDFFVSHIEIHDSNIFGVT